MEPLAWNPHQSLLAECHWMTAKRSGFPQDISGCYALIERQQAESEQQQRIIEQQQRTIEEQQATLANLSVDMQLLKRALFGSRRERFIDDPRQGHLFESNAQEGTASESGDSQPADPETEEPPPDTSVTNGFPPRIRGHPGQLLGARASQVR